MKEDFGIKEMALIQELFRHKKWEIEEDSSYKSFFNRFCKRYSLIKNDDCRQLFLDLSKAFFRLNVGNNLLHIINDMLNKIETEVQLFQKVYIVPLKKYGSDAKSADMIWQQIKYHKTMLSGLSFYNRIELKSLNDLKEKYRISLSPHQYLIILIDDFIGSGNTVKDVYKDLLEKEIIDKSNYVYVLALVGMEEGASFLSESLKIDFAIHTLLKKGLSSRFADDILKEKMDLIAKSTINDIKMKSKRSFLGYRESESLYAFGERAANNTFPIFWFEKTTKDGHIDQAHYAPFNRN